MAAVARMARNSNSTAIAAGRTSMPRPTTSSGGIEGYSGVKLAEAFAIPDLDREVKWDCKYARQNGIHVSPTFI
jgi:hypothetical protein